MDAILHFIWRSIVSFLFLFFAPAILLVVPLLVVHYLPGDDTVGLLKVLLGVLGPFAASFWFLICCKFPKFYAAARDGGHVNGGIGFHVKAIGKMVFAFLTSGALAFYVGAPRFNIASNESDSLWFIEMYLALFSPIFFLLLGWRLIKIACVGRQTCKCCCERVGGANLDELRLCSYCRADALNEQETDEEQEAWIRKVEEEFEDKQWAAELRNGRRIALRWKRRILSSR
jgi:hypothetical protein